MWDVDNSREHLIPPKVFGSDTPLFELFEQQHLFLESLVTQISKLVPENQARTSILGALEDYQTNVDAILQKRQADIFNGRGEHSRMESLLRHRSLMENGYDEVVDPFPSKDESQYSLLEGLIRDLIIPYSQELLFSAARQELPTDIYQAKRGIYEATPSGMTLILRPNDQIVRFTISNKSHVLPVVLERTTYGNEVFMRENVETMIRDLFELINEYEFLKNSQAVKDAAPIEKDLYTSILSMNLPAYFGDESKYFQPIGFKGLCFQPFTSFKAACVDLERNPIQLRMCFREDRPLDSVVLLFALDEDTFLSIDTDCELKVHHYSTKESVWVTVRDYFPYISTNQFYETMNAFFSEHGHKPRYKATL
jgi:hypothetical protein